MSIKRTKQILDLIEEDMKGLKPDAKAAIEMLCSFFSEFIDHLKGIKN